MALPTAKPTDELQRRHEVEAPRIDGTVRRPFWQHFSRFERLYANQSLSDAGYHTGCCWRTDYELVATQGMPSPDLDRIAGTGGASWSPPAGVLDAQGRLREADAILGEWRRLLIDVLVEDRSWASLAVLYGARREVELQRAVVVLLTELEPVYAHLRQPV